MIIDLDIKRRRKKKKTRVPCVQPRIRWGGLTTARPFMIGLKLAATGACGSSGDVDNMWSKTTDCIMIATREVLGISRPVDTKRIGGGIERFKEKWKSRRFLC